MDLIAFIKEIGGGLPAAVIAVLGWAFWKKSEKVDALQEQRIEEAKAMIEAHHAVADNMAALAATFKELAAEIRAGGSR